MAARDSSDLLFKRLEQSRLYRDYRRAFTRATGLPLALIPASGMAHPHKGDACENKFCRMLAESAHTCEACLMVQEKLRHGAVPGGKGRTVVCFAGLCDSVVPVQQGSRTIGFLQTGQVMTARPSRARFRQFARQLGRDGTFDTGELEKAYAGTKVVPPGQYEAVVGLLAIFAAQLSTASESLALQAATDEPLPVARARAFIRDRQAEPLTLGMAAAHVHLSTFYFCKVFKKSTGLSFTDYLARVRIERARRLLSNRRLRVSEIAYQVGFQSLSQFNRAFRRVTGESPTHARAQLAR